MLFRSLHPSKGGTTHLASIVLARLDMDSFFDDSVRALSERLCEGNVEKGSGPVSLARGGGRTRPVLYCDRMGVSSLLLLLSCCCRGGTNLAGDCGHLVTLGRRGGGWEGGEGSDGAEVGPRMSESVVVAAGVGRTRPRGRTAKSRRCSCGVQIGRAHV